MKEHKYMLDMTLHQTTAFAKNLLQQTLKKISVIEKIDDSVNHGNDIPPGIMVIKLTLFNDKIIMFFAEVLSSGEPRIVKNSIAKLKKISSETKCSTPSTYLAIMAPYISPASSQICEENSVGYLDYSGNCLLRHLQFHIEINGRPNKYVLKKSKKKYLVRSSLKVSKILREMMASPERFWQINELSKITETSLGTVSNVKQFLLEKDWIIENEKKFRIGNAGELLKEWALDYNKTPNISHEYYSMNPIPQLEKRIADLFISKKIKCHLGVFAAAVRYSPTVRYNKVAVYVSQNDFDKVVETLQLKEVSSGGNVVLIIPYDSCVLSHSRKINRLSVTSPVQTVLDLYGQSGRGEEAAEAIIAKEYGNNA